MRRCPDSTPAQRLSRELVYITSWNGQVYALRATTGALVWQKSVDFGSSADCPPKGPSGTPAVVKDPVRGASTLYVTGSHYLYALNPTTGAQLWKAAMGPATAAGEARWYDWSSPLVVGGKIYVGMTSACSDLIRGGVLQFNQHTGKRLHTWYAVPAGKVGTSVWTSQAGDGTNVWVTTGNPDPNAGQVYDAFSIVRLSASDLTKVDKWTTPTPINDDLDFGGSPSFVTATINGVSTQMVGACNKNGNFYMFKRNNLAAGPIWQRQVGAVGGTLQGACVTSPAFDSAQNAIWVAGNQTTINGVTAQGSIRKLDPATGAIEWEQPLGCIPDGSPTLNATTHVLAVPLYRCANGAPPGMALFDSATGRPLRMITTPGLVFAQGVFAEGKLFVADESGNLTAWGP